MILLIFRESSRLRIHAAEKPRSGDDQALQDALPREIHLRQPPSRCPGQEEGEGALRDLQGRGRLLQGEEGGGSWAQTPDTVPLQDMPGGDGFPPGDRRQEPKWRPAHSAVPHPGRWASAGSPKLLGRRTEPPSLLVAAQVQVLPKQKRVGASSWTTPYPLYPGFSCGQPHCPAQLRLFAFLIFF